MAILAIQYPIYQPAMRIIGSILKSNPIYVTTTSKHDYGTGMIVRLNIPAGFGMTQANQLYGPITVLDEYSFTMPIDAVNFDTFATPTSFPDDRQYAQCTPIGEKNEFLRYATRNVLPY